MTHSTFTPYSALTADELSYMDAQRWAHRCHDMCGKPHVVVHDGRMYWVLEEGKPAPIGGDVVYTTEEAWTDAIGTAQA